MRIFDQIEEHSVKEVVDFILSINDLPKHILLVGDLGAGKTTFVKQLVKAMGYTDEVSSPTFSLINEYTASNNRKIIHSDWYRIKDIEELIDAGMEEYLDSANLCIIEWPEVGEVLLKHEPYLLVEIMHLPQGRKYTISTVLP